jgi:hypothetical protein
LQINTAFFVKNPQWIEADTTDVPGTTIERLAEVHGNRKDASPCKVLKLLVIFQSICAL